MFRSAQATDSAPSRLLILSANADERHSLAHLFASDGYCIESARDGEQGLATVARFRPDAVLCDWVLPGMDGLSFCRTLKSDVAFEPPHVTLVSGRSSMGERLRGIEAGADDLVVRPIEPDDLRARLRAAIVGRQKRGKQEEARRETAIRELAATVGHEINNPLTALFGHMELMLHYLEQGDPSRMQHHIKEAGEVASRIGDVARRLTQLDEVKTKQYLESMKMVDIGK
ncbi:hypothetical protein ABI59_21385 [Acidobacteria bacterium Mor1]|nr:hypothetical protein ABI59_21385 [Acidobacteria bacterium Mor1]